ncbi:hypothetical protein [Actinacidiphila yeochonensis]|uniref:hypothetical protein n=1 Tax=Actinacidiphila yeochonensis TaxID=89050 RepID=UPI000690D13E|nr:hypothetical protein [Actinacidiphila yeochonensis]
MTMKTHHGSAPATAGATTPDTSADTARETAPETTPESEADSARAPRETAAAPNRPAAERDPRTTADHSTGHGTDHSTGHGPSTAAPTRTVEGGDLAERMEHAVGGFVDDPKGAVAEAESVLDEAAARLVRMVEERRTSLHDSWQGHQGSGSDTEELRVALTRIRDMSRKLLDFAS